MSHPDQVTYDSLLRLAFRDPLIRSSRSAIAVVASRLTGVTSSGLSHGVVALLQLSPTSNADVLVCTSVFGDLIGDLIRTDGCRLELSRWTVLGGGEHI